MTTMNAAATSRPARKMFVSDRPFFVFTALAMVAVIAIGFAPTFYLRPAFTSSARELPLTAMVILHGLVFTTWLLIYVAQVGLVAGGRVDLHRRVGNVGIVMLPLLVGMGALTALLGVGRPFTAPPGIPPLSWLAMPLLDVPLYAALIALALNQRARPATHKRLMFLSLVTMMPPGFGRFPVPLSMLPVMTVLAPTLFLLALVAWDLYSTRRVSRVTAVGGGIVLAVWLAKPLIWGTDWWLAFARWASVPFV